MGYVHFLKQIETRSPTNYRRLVRVASLILMLASNGSALFVHATPSDAMAVEPAALAVTAGPYETVLQPSNDLQAPKAQAQEISREQGKPEVSLQPNDTCTITVRENKNSQGTLTPQIIHAPCSNDYRYDDLTEVPNATSRQHVPTAPPLYDDFNDTSYDNSYNPSLWTYEGVDYIQARQSNGSMVFSNATAPLSGDANLVILQPYHRTLRQVQQFEARLKVSNDHVGGFGLVKIQVLTPDLNGHGWWVQCHIASASFWPQPRFYCDMFTYVGSSSTAEYFSPEIVVNYETWYSVRMEADPSTANLRFFLNSTLVGSHTPNDASALVSANNLTARIGVWNGQAGIFVTRHIDDVRITSAEPFHVSGTVTAGRGDPITGARISDNAGHTVSTDSNGNYTLTNLAEGTYTFTASKNGYTFSPSSRTVSVPPNATGVNFTGYDKPPIVFVHGWNGGDILNWSCDWVEPDGYFQGTDNLLRDAGYYVEYARLESSTCYTPPIEENVWRLDNAIQLAKAATNQSQVILIGHSMGGLVSRAYLESAVYDDDVAQLFTFASPHQGVPDDLVAFFANGLSLGVYCRDYQPAVCDFSYLGMQLFNQNHPDREAGVTYHVVSGDAPVFPRTVFGMLANALLDGPDDGAVQTWSGLGLGGHLDRWQTDETHGPGSGPRSYFIRDGGPSTSYFQCLKRVLVDRATDHCGTVGPSEEVLPITSTSPKHSPFLYGTLLPGQTNSRPITVEGGATLFAAQWQPGTVQMTLIDPSGQTIDPAYAAAHPGIVTYQDSVGYATYSFPNAAPGTWQVRLQAISVPAAGASYTAFAAFDSALALSAGTDRPWYTPGATAIISATLSPVPQSATVAATILLSDSTSTTVTLTPLGGGRYQGSYLVPATPGYAEVRLNATGVNASGVPFERGASLAFQIAPSTVALNGIYSDTPEPRWPGAPIYKALSVAVGVNVSQAGAYGLSVDLVDSAGHHVAHTNTISDLSSGTGTLALRFHGTDILASQHDGPYTLTSLLLTDHNGVTLVAQEAQSVYTTAAYEYRDFRTGDLFLPLLIK